MLKAKQLDCDACGRSCNIRSACKNPESEFFRKKLCPGCSHIHAIPKEKPHYQMPKQTEKNKEKRKAERAGYGEFYIKHVNHIKVWNRRCAECGIPLSGTIDNVCHILSKSVHKEVATEDNNIIYLCSRFEDGPNCHSVFDRSLESRGKMKVFEKVARNAEHYLLPLTKKYSPEVQHIEEYLKNILDNIE